MGGDLQQGLAFTCSCGAFRGRITPAGARRGTRVMCHCADCRAGQLYFGQPDPAPGPVDILQIAPETIEIEQGSEHLAVMQLSPKGTLRWYANCCNAPIAATTRTPKFPFAGFLVQRIADSSELGPVRTRGFVPRANGTTKHENPGPAVFGILWRTLRSRLSGSWKNTPFFDIATGKPVAKPTLVSQEEKRALYP